MGSGSLSVIFDPAYTPMLNDSFDLLNWSAAVGSGIQGIDPSLLSLDRTGFDPSWDWDLSAFTSSGVITVGLIPEPSRLLLAGLGFSAMLMRRRRPTC